MIYYFLFPLHTEEGLGFLNVLRYVPFRMLAAAMTAVLLAFGFYPWFIRRLQKKQIGQVIREDGPESHLSKAGTPTMGGALILLALVVSTLLWADPTNPLIWVVTAITASFGAIGYLDDALKIRKKSSGGLPGRWKLILQFAISLSVCTYLWYGEAGLPDDWLWLETHQVDASGEPISCEADSECNAFVDARCDLKREGGSCTDRSSLRNRLALPFLAFDKYELTLPPWLYVLFAAFVMVAMSNAVNLTDGLDGLAIGPVMINSATYLVLAYLAGLTVFGQPVAAYLHIAPIASASELAVFCGAMVGTGIGFLWYNTYPAQVFMGDVGSLALGGGLGAFSVLTKNEFLGAILGGIFVVEAISVIGQVGWFKMTRRRIFLMAPIHHHFEKKGWAEPKIIVRFWIISVFLAFFALATLKLR